MKLIVQKVRSAKVTCESCEKKESQEIKRGLLVYAAFSTDCTEKKIEKAASKLSKLRVFSDGNSKFANSIKEAGEEILIISNFTLYGFLDGNKPNFKNSQSYEEAEKFYNMLINKTRENYDAEKVKGGYFGEFMAVESECEGPLNLDLDF